MDEKDLYGTVIFDILAISLATILSTINVLTYIFTVASIILLLQALKDIRKYKISKVYNKNKFTVLVVLVVVAIIALAMLISVVATKNKVFTYVVYGVAGFDFLVTLVLYTKEYLTQKKLKKEATDTPTKAENIDFVVKEMGTSKDRNTAEQDTIKEQNDDTNTLNNQTNTETFENEDLAKITESEVNDTKNDD